MMTAAFRVPADLSEYLFRITDNGGATADRYTVAFSDGSYLSMSDSPTHPQGVSMWGEDIDPATMNEWVENGQEVDLALGDLAPNLVDHIIARSNEGLKDFLQAVAAKAPEAVAQSRESAKENDGTLSSLGKGIYRSEGSYFIRLEGPAGEDRGPFSTAREVVLASLPDQHSFAGTEYHSTLDVMRLEPDPEVASRITELEAHLEGEKPQPAGLA